MSFLAMTESLAFGYYSIYYQPGPGIRPGLFIMSLVVFLFSALYLLIFLYEFVNQGKGMKKLADTRDSRLFLIAAVMSLASPIIPSGSTSEWQLSFTYTVFFGFFMPLLIFALVFRMKGGLRPAAKTDWLSTAFFGLTLFLIVASAAGIASEFAPSVSFYGSSGDVFYDMDHPPENRLFMNGDVLYARICVRNTGFAPAENIEVVYRNTTIYKIGFLVGKSAGIYVFPLREVPQISPNESGNLSAQLSLRYGGNTVDTMTIYIPAYQDTCGDVLLVMAGLILAYRRKKA